MVTRNGLVLILVSIGGLALVMGLGSFGAPWPLLGAAGVIWILAGVYGYLTRQRRGYRAD